MKRFRVICTDNYARSGERPGFDEIFITVPLSERLCKEIAAGLNSTRDILSQEYFCVVDEEYKLNVFEI